VVQTKVPGVLSSQLFSAEFVMTLHSQASFSVAEFASTALSPAQFPIFLSHWHGLAPLLSDGFIHTDVTHLHTFMIKGQ
jgi:hypothetical protein